MNAVNFFRSSIQILNKISQYSNHPMDKNHPLYGHLDFCNKALNNNGRVILESDGAVSKLSQILLDCVILIELTRGDLRNFTLGKTLPHEKNTQQKIKARILNSEQYRGLVVELYVYAWHTLSGHITELWEREGLPDIKVEVPGISDLFLIACTHRDKSDLPPARLEKYADRAEKQVETAEQQHGGQYHGVSLIDVSLPVGASAVNNDGLPGKIVNYTVEMKRLLDSGKYKHIRSIILVWDDYIKEEMSNKRFFVLRRRSNIISPQGYKGLPLFKGYDAFVSLDKVDNRSFNSEIIEGDLKEIRLSIVPRSYAWFKATCYALADQLITYGKPEKITD